MPQLGKQNPSKTYIFYANQFWLLNRKQHMGKLITALVAAAAAAAKFLIAFAFFAVAAAQVSNEYLPPHAGNDLGGGSYAFESHHVEAAPSHSAPVESYEVEAAPAHSFSDADGYRYKTQRRRVYKTVRRSRRGLSNEYLHPSMSAPAHTFSDADGYRYKTLRRRVYRRQRRDVSLEYLPPVASQTASASAPQYSAPAPQYSAPAPQYSAPAAVESYEVEAAPAHSFSDSEGYRYKTQRRRVYRRH
ncbi:uncharacterized protein LOC131997637 [Stomoxys calcitrans]|uniref:uncharacterized protein LOC131997637 n=1 Tax=Stomoxys calcitrans TaxID=35570 RepID=UPI0027E21999|nr:uncharacterized protein LOC131997637 [Stomoxys calcitrans]